MESMDSDASELEELTESGSENYFDFPCSPCKLEGNIVETSKHCVDCDENLCTMCLKHHNKFAILRGHRMLDKGQIPTGRTQKISSQTCDQHRGKLIDVYCPDHNVVCCSTCAAFDHRSCLGIKVIQDAAGDIQNSEEIREFKIEMASLKSRFVVLKKSKDKDLQSLQQIRDEIQKEIRTLRRKINDRLDKMELKLMNETDAIVSQKMQYVDADMNYVVDALAELKMVEKHLEANEDVNEAETFVILKTGQETQKKLSAFADKQERFGKIGHLKLTVNQEIDELLNGTSGMGQINDSYNKVCTVPYGEFNVRAQEDRAECDKVYGICLASGNVFLTDYSNKRLKKLDHSYNLSAYTSLPDNPVGVCSIDEKQLAVTLINVRKVQFVSNEESMRLFTSFSTRDRCRGIAYSNGLIYVCCGGSKERTDEGPGHLEVFDMNGTLLRSFYGPIFLPRTICVSYDGNVLYIADKVRGLIILKKNGSFVFQHRYKSLDGYRGICRLNDTTLCVAGHVSNNIAVITDDGLLQEMLLTHKCIEAPCGLCYDEKHARLIVCLSSMEKIKVFQMHLDGRFW